jgi:DNA-3-methyladenine glycosylase I
VAATDDNRVTRCSWAGNDPLYVDYHDREWGVPLYDDCALFEKLVLDGFQAGLSWIIILRKRENLRRAFDSFDPVRIARYTPKKVERLVGPTIVYAFMQAVGMVNDHLVSCHRHPDFGARRAGLAPKQD